MRSIIVLFVAAGFLQADDWPQWLGPKRDSIWRETGILEKFPEGGPKKLWSEKVGIGYAGPAVKGGTVFITDWKLAEGAKTPGNPFDNKSTIKGVERVLRLDAKTGREFWKHEYPVTYQISYAAGPRCTPVIDEHAVYTLGAMGDLFCLDDVNGDVRWKKNLVSDFGGKVPVWGFACHPIIDGNKLIVVGGGPGKLIIALNRLSGEVIWTSQTCEGDFGYGPPTIETFDGVRQLIVWHRSAVVSVDPESGKRLWQFSFDSKAALTAPAPRKVGDDRLFLTSFYHGAFMLKVTKNGAEVVWKSTAKGERPNLTTDLSSIMSTPFVDGEHIYGVDSYGELRCLTLTGKRVWMTMKATRGKLTSERIAASETPAESERWSNAFIVKNGDRFFLFNEQGDLIIAKLSPTGYEELSRAHLIDPVNTMAGRGRKVVWMHPAFADQCIFVRNDAEVVCFNLEK